MNGNRKCLIWDSWYLFTSSRNQIMRSNKHLTKKHFYWWHNCTHTTLHNWRFRTGDSEPEIQNWRFTEKLPQNYPNYQLPKWVIFQNVWRCQMFCSSFQGFGLRRWSSRSEIRFLRSPKVTLLTSRKRHTSFGFFTKKKKKANLQ